jgi:TRAP-type mannitol/chloroaromatic compound transport system substrate-binding protein
MRMPGLGGEVLANLGTQVINLPGGEIQQALKAGRIDAAEWAGPYNDLTLGLHQAARYYYWPGWHEPGTAIELIVNRRTYEALPRDLQEVVAQATQAAYSAMLAEYSLGNTDALATLVHTHKVQLRRFPNAVLAAVGKLSQEVVAAVAAYDPLARKIYEAFHALRQKTVGWSQIGEEAYSLARSLTFSP